jgi:hypothetical protein
MLSLFIALLLNTSASLSNQRPPEYSFYTFLCSPFFQKPTVQSLPTTHLAITFSDKPQRINNSSSLEQRITQTLTSDHLTQKALKILHIYTQKECKKITHKTVQELTAMFKQDLSHFTDDLLEDTTLPEQIAYELFDIYSRANKNRWNKNSYKQYYQKVSDTLEERKKLQFQEAKLLKDKQQQEGLNLYNQQLKQKQVETSQQLLQRFVCEASINNQIIEQSVRNNKLLDHQLLPEILPNLPKYQDYYLNLNKLLEHKLLVYQKHLFFQI